MAHDYTIPLGKPGIAAFESESYGGSGELLFGDGITRTITRTVTAGANLDLPLGSVVMVTAGVIALATVAGASYGITAAPVLLANGASMSVPIYVSGHFNMNALTWDATFNTDALKEAAFDDIPNRLIQISKPKYNDANFPA